MAYLICTGADGTSRQTKGGIKCRGYHAYRRGTLVQTWWGPLEIRRERTLSYHGARKWLGKQFKFRTEAAARTYLLDRIERLCMSGSGYRIAGQRINYQRGELRD